MIDVVRVRFRPGFFKRVPRRHAGHAAEQDARPVSHKIEFSFLNGNLMVPASQLFIFNCDTFPMMEEHMFGESAQALLFLAIVVFTVASTIDRIMQPIKQKKNTDREH
jgi:hypothetical protein